MIPVAPLIAAALIAIASIVGLLDAAIYARETASWAAQGVGQDWFDLLVLAPALVGAWLWARRDPIRGARVLAGVLACTVYTFVIYTFALHFNALFLVYCAVLGLSVFSLGATTQRILAANADRGARRERFSGAFFLAAVLFALLWLADIVPALARGAAPPSLAENGLLTNPVHVLDLAIVLPSFAAIGVLLLRGRPLARSLGEVAATFSVLMALSIATLMIVVQAGAITVAMLALAAASGAVLVHLLRAEALP